MGKVKTQSLRAYVRTSLLNVSSKHRAERLVEKLGDLDESLIEKMTPLAEEVIAKEPDVKKAIARCLCLAVGAVGKMKPRSILTSQEG